MNSFYHEFIMGFNFYYIVAPALIVGVICIATKQYKLNLVRYKGRYNKKYKVSAPKFNENVYRLYAAIAAIIVAAMVLMESFDGIIQWHDNHALTGADPIVSVIIAMLDVAVIIPLCYGLLVFGIGRLASWAWLGYLTEQKSKKSSGRYISPRV